MGLIEKLKKLFKKFLRESSNPVVAENKLKESEEKFKRLKNELGWLKIREQIEKVSKEIRGDEVSLSEVCEFHTRFSKFCYGNTKDLLWVINTKEKQKRDIMKELEKLQKEFPELVEEFIRKSKIFRQLEEQIQKFLTEIDNLRQISKDFKRLLDTKIEIVEIKSNKKIHEKREKKTNKIEKVNFRYRSSDPECIKRVTRHIYNTDVPEEDAKYFTENIYRLKKKEIIEKALSLVEALEPIYPNLQWEKVKKLKEKSNSR